MRTHAYYLVFYRLQIYSLKLCLHRMFFFTLQGWFYEDSSLIYSSPMAMTSFRAADRVEATICEAIRSKSR